MKLQILAFICLLNSFTGFAVVTPPSETEKDSVPPELWQHIHKFGIILTQTSFVNWSAGGNNSIAGILTHNTELNYKKNRLFWDNKLRARFGLNKEEGTDTRKTDDVLEINSNLGYQSSETSRWYYSSRFNFRTQFAKGYKYPDRDNEISDFFAPAYLFLGAGTQYTDTIRKFKFYASPLTNKITFVLNQKLSDEGAFGVNKGEKVKSEFGTLVTGDWTYQLMKNIEMKNRLSLYSDYINRFGNIDVDWELSIKMTVNKYVTANLGTHVIYDDDAVIEGEPNARVQLKQLLGVGITYQLP